MPTRSSAPDILLDTSAAIAFVLADHDAHAVTTETLASLRLGLAGHAAFETFSVLTRLPAPARRSPGTVAQVLSSNFPDTRFLSPSAANALLPRLADAGIGGGSVYDALIGAAAAEHGLALATRDRRAVDVYRILGVEIEILPDP